MNTTLLASALRAALVLTAAVLDSAQASTVLTSANNADNMFIEYLSSSPTSIATAAVLQAQTTDTDGSQSLWANTYTNASAISGGLQYLIVEVQNVGGIGGLLADFSLSGTNYQFENGTQTLLTSAADWTVSTTGINGIYTGVTVEGANGVSPWGLRTGVNAGADWISDATFGNPGNNGGYSTEYFETAISAKVPEPASIALLALGLLALRATRSRTGLLA